jgi:hypothetical protein
MQNVKRVSSGFFVGSVAGGLLVGILFVILGVAGNASSPNDSAPVILLAVGFLLALYAEIVFLVLLYKAWACIQDGSTRTTPRKAVGLLFIPIFNWFWIFRAIPGYADEYNSYLDRTNLPARRLTKGSLQAFAVLSVLTIIPILGGIAALIALFVGCGVADKLCTAINALAEIAPIYKDQSLPQV